MARTISLERLCIYLYIVVSMVALNSGATSVKIVRVVVVAAILIGFLHRGSIRLPHKGDRYYLLWAIMFSVYCGIGIFFAHSKSMALSFFMTMMYVFIVDFLIYIYVLCYMKNVEGIINCMVIGAVLIALRCFAQYGLFAFMSSRSAGSISGNTIGQFSAFASVMCVYKLRNIGHGIEIPRRGLLWYILLILNLIFVVLSGSRKSVFYLIIPFIVVLVLRSKNPIRLVRNLVIAVAFSFSVYYALMHITVLYSTIGHRIETMINGFMGVGLVDSSTETRLNLINRGMRFFRNRPWIGYGLNNFFVLNKALTGSVYYAHNNYVELLVDCGIVGTVVYYSLHAVSLINAFKNREKYKGFEIVFIGIMVAIVVCDYGIVTYYDIYIQLLCLLSVLVILHPEFLGHSNSCG